MEVIEDVLDVISTGNNEVNKVIKNKMDTLKNTMLANSRNSTSTTTSLIAFEGLNYIYDTFTAPAINLVKLGQRIVSLINKNKPKRLNKRKSIISQKNVEIHNSSNQNSAKSSRCSSPTTSTSSFEFDGQVEENPIPIGEMEDEEFHNYIDDISKFTVVKPTFDSIKSEINDCIEIDDCIDGGGYDYVDGNAYSKLKRIFFKHGYKVLDKDEFSNCIDLINQGEYYNFDPDLEDEVDGNGSSKKVKVAKKALTVLKYVFKKVFNNKCIDIMDLL